MAKNVPAILVRAASATQPAIFSVRHLQLLFGVSVGAGEALGAAEVLSALRDVSRPRHLLFLGLCVCLGAESADRWFELTP